MFTNPRIQDKLLQEKTHALLWAEPKREKDYANRINEGKWPVGKP